MALLVNLTQFRVTREESLNEGLSIQGWLVGMSVERLSRLVEFIGLGRPSPMWVAPFPKQGVLNYVRVQRSTSRSKQGST